MSFSGMNNLAYDTFEPGLNGQIEYEASIYSLFTRTTKGVEGRTCKIKLQTGDGSVGNIQEGGDFPPGIDPTTDEASITLQEITGTLEFTTREAGLLNGATAGAEAVVMFKMDNLKDTMRRDIVRQGWNDGTGTLARCSAATNVNVVPIQSTTTNQYDRDRSIWLAANRISVDFVDATTGVAITNGTGRTISAVSFVSGSSTVTVTGTANLTPTSNTVIVRTGNVYSSSNVYTSLEYPGLEAIINDGNVYLGKDRTVAGNAFWKATNLNNSGTLRPLSMPLVMQLRSELAKQGKQPTAPDYVYMANQGVFNAYAELLTPQIRYQQINDGLKQLDGGWASLSIFGTDLLEDIHCPRNNLFAIYQPGISFRVAKHSRRNVFQFIDDDGAVFRMKPGVNPGRYAAAWQAHLDGFCALVSERPNKHGRLNDIAETGVV